VYPRRVAVRGSAATAQGGVRERPVTTIRTPMRDATRMVLNAGRYGIRANVSLEGSLAHHSDTANYRE